MSRTTAPPGYESNYAAIMDLIRYGPAIWSCSQFQALLFHAERSTAYGKDADKHSEKQAIEGIYSARTFSWVRGPSGLSRANWYRANAELVIDNEDPRKTPLGVLRVHRSGAGRGQVIEYALDWKFVTARIQKWKGSQSETLSTKEGSQFETFKGLNLRPFSEDAPVENKRAGKKEGSQFETHSQSLLVLDSDSRSESSLLAAISLELELVCEQRLQTDRPARQILKAGQKLDLPLECISRFMHEKADEFRGRRYRFTPGLMAEAFGREIIPWIRRNAEFVSSRRKRQALNRIAETKLIDEQPPAESPDPNFGRDLIRDVRNRRAKGAKA